MSEMVLHVTNIPTPYRLPTYRVTRKALADHGLDLHVFFLGKSNRQRSWNISDDELAEIPHTQADPARGKLFDQIVERITVMQPAAVVLAWAMNGLALRLLLECRRRKIPCIVYTGETDRAITFLRWHKLRDLYRRIFFRLADGFIAYGRASTEYLVRRGVRPDRISVAINVVDTEFFRSSVAEESESGRASDFRNSFDGDRCHLLLVSYMIPGKGLDLTLDAMKSLNRPDVLLHIVGSGPEEEMLRSRCRELGLVDQVVFHGYKQKAELPLYYATADILLFPSLIDPFGLVMVEGAAASLPIIASSWSGGTIDVVQPEVNGYVVDPRDPSEYAEALRRLISSPDLRRSMGAASKQKAVSELTPARHAEGYLEGVLRAIRSTPIVEANT